MAEQASAVPRFQSKYALKVAYVTAVQHLHSLHHFVAVLRGVGNEGLLIYLGGVLEGAKSNGIAEYSSVECS